MTDNSIPKIEQVNRYDLELGDTKSGMFLSKSGYWVYYKDYEKNEKELQERIKELEEGIKVKPVEWSPLESNLPLPIKKSFKVKAKVTSVTKFQPKLYLEDLGDEEIEDMKKQLQEYREKLKNERYAYLKSQQRVRELEAENNTLELLNQHWYNRVQELKKQIQ